jgi:hypothetical protein
MNERTIEFPALLEGDMIRIPEVYREAVRSVSRGRGQVLVILEGSAAQDTGAENDAYETGRRYFGRYGSGKGNLSRDYSRST